MLRIDGPRLPPSGGGRPTKLVILAHGYGSNGADLIGLGRYWARAFPDTVFVSPNAPEPVPGFPAAFSGFRSRAWTPPLWRRASGAPR
jgi:phospholipase/carboxylesterase